MNPEAIEAAAKVLHDRWDSGECLTPEDEAEAALEAAAPYLIREARAELEEMQEWQNTVANRMPERYEDDIAQEAIIDRWLDDLTDGTLIREARAAELETAAEWLAIPSQNGGGLAATWLRARAAAIRAGD